jgi:hypothetical protein
MNAREIRASIGGTSLAQLCRMTRIPIWSSGTRECLLVVDDQSAELLLLQDHEVIRRTAPLSEARAIQLSDAWRRGLEWDTQHRHKVSPMRSAA